MVVGARLARLAVHKLLLLYWDFITLAQQCRVYRKWPQKEREKKIQSVMWRENGSLVLGAADWTPLKGKSSSNSRWL